jgi:hypothetical protein
MISGLYATPIKTNQDQSRIDAPGVLHLIIAKGIKRKRIFTEPKTDRIVSTGNRGRLIILPD